MRRTEAPAETWNASAILPYAQGAGAVLCALVVRQVFDPLLDGNSLWLLFTLAITVATQLGGVGPGLAATAIGAPLGWYFVVEPQIAHYVAFILVGVAISFLSGRSHRVLAQTARISERNRLLSEALPELIWTCRPTGQCDHVNECWIHYTGIPAVRQLGSAWMEQVHPDDYADVRQAWMAATSAGEEFRMQIRLRRYDGVYRWFDVRVTPWRDAQGRMERWFGCGSDIDDAHNTLEALRGEHERLTRIADASPAVICAFRLRPDGSTCFPYTSPAIQEIYDLQPRELREDATPAFERIHPDDIGYVRASIAESARTMMPWRGEFRVNNPKRGEIWVEGHSQPARLPDGSVEWYGFLADITARRRMEQDLRDHASRLEALNRTLDLAQVSVLTPDGTITYWSDGASAMYGWSAEEAVGRCAHELLKTEFPAPLEEINAVLAATGRWEGELRHFRRDGSQVVVASRWGLHRDEHGKPQSLTEINVDITERKHIEEQLEASEQRFRLAQAAAGIATWDWDLRENQTVCSIGYGPLFGLPRSGIAPPWDEWIELVHPDDRERIRQDLLDALAGVRQYDTEFRVIWPDGAVRWLLGKGRVYRDATGQPARFLGINMDVTERKTAAEQLRALSASLISVQEEERRRISRELHDDLVQRLGFITIDLARTAGTARGSPVLQDRLRALQQRTVEAAELTRHIAHELHPSILDDLGIEAALRSYCEEFARREAIAVKFTSRNLPPSIKREICSCLYAVAQESLLNVSKHAQAEHVDVLLEGATDRVCLTVSDDGIGFCFDRTVAQPGLGIVNMRERVRSVRGNFSLESQPGRGTQLAVEIPR